MNLAEQLYQAGRLFLRVSCTLTEALEPQQSGIMRGRIASLEQTFLSSFLEDNIAEMQKTLGAIIELGNDLSGLLPLD